MKELSKEISPDDQDFAALCFSIAVCFFPALAVVFTVAAYVLLVD